jgi:glycerophosphoryl diester phosphodiesterase
MGRVRSSRRAAGEPPIGFAHRGARAECPDNTLRSFARALELGATGLESDAWVTADGVVVLDHDGVVRRGLRRVAIADLRAEELPGHIPTLEQLLAVCDREVELSLDVKDARTAEPTIALLERAGRAERTWLCGTGALLASWRSLSAEVRLVDSTRLSRVREGLAVRVDRLASTGVDAVNLRWPEWDPARLGIVHAAGLLAFAWDAQAAGTIAALAAMGLDGVYSDHPGRLAEVLRASPTHARPPAPVRTSGFATGARPGQRPAR